MFGSIQRAQPQNPGSEQKGGSISGQFSTPAASMNIPNTGVNKGLTPFDYFPSSAFEGQGGSGANMLSGQQGMVSSGLFKSYPSSMNIPTSTYLTQQDFGQPFQKENSQQAQQGGNLTQASLRDRSAFNSQPEGRQSSIENRVKSEKFFRELQSLFACQLDKMKDAIGDDIRTLKEHEDVAKRKIGSGFESISNNLEDLKNDVKAAVRTYGKKLEDNYREQNSGLGEISSTLKEHTKKFISFTKLKKNKILDSFEDLFTETFASLQASLSGLGGDLAHLKSQLAQDSDFIVDRLSNLTTQQQALMAESVQRYDNTHANLIGFIKEQKRQEKLQQQANSAPSEKMLEELKQIKKSFEDQLKIRDVEMRRREELRDAEIRRLHELLNQNKNDNRKPVNFEEVFLPPPKIKLSHRKGASKGFNDQLSQYQAHLQTLQPNLTQDEQKLSSDWRRGTRRRISSSIQGRSDLEVMRQNNKRLDFLRVAPPREEDGEEGEEEECNEENEGENDEKEDEQIEKETGCQEQESSQGEKTELQRPDAETDNKVTQENKPRSGRPKGRKNNIRKTDHQSTKCSSKTDIESNTPSNKNDNKQPQKKKNKKPNKKSKSNSPTPSQNSATRERPISTKRPYNMPIQPTSLQHPIQDTPQENATAAIQKANKQISQMRMKIGPFLNP
jgi:hypothetical protein